MGAAPQPIFIVVARWVPGFIGNNSACVNATDSRNRNHSLSGLGAGRYVLGKRMCHSWEEPFAIASLESSIQTHGRIQPINNCLLNRSSTETRCIALPITRCALFPFLRMVPPLIDTCRDARAKQAERSNNALDIGLNRSRFVGKHRVESPTGSVPDSCRPESNQPHLYS
jgi:hypothetical protein